MTTLIILVLINASATIILALLEIKNRKRHQRWLEEEMKMWGLQMEINNEIISRKERA